MANLGLSELFSLLDNGAQPPADLSDCDLFGCTEKTYAQKDIDVISGLYSKKGLAISPLNESARLLFSVSINAFDAFVHAWMSETCAQTAILNFGRKVLSAAKNAPRSAGGENQRKSANIAASDRSDPDTVTVLKAAYKARWEVHRLYGLLRFSPNSEGVYIAPCSPDHFVLPAFGGHFSLRFGDTPWAVVDEKRRVSVFGLKEKVGFYHFALISAEDGEWEALWRHYHQTINNEDRKNLSLQRQFMPQRYRKYLPEV
jgi:hypothetical protein